MASVSADDVRDALNLTPADIPDSKVIKMIKRAEVTLELELEKDLDYTSCTDAEKEAITILAAIYAICYLSGGTAIGMNFSIGDQYINVLTKAPSLHVLSARASKIDNETWSVYYAAYFASGDGLYFDAGGWVGGQFCDSRIVNFSWTPSATPPAVPTAAGDGLVWVTR